MPAVLSLLRSKAREVIKAVLGMLKVQFVVDCCRVPGTSSGSDSGLQHHVHLNLQAALFQTAARQIDAHSRIPLHLSLHSRSTEQLHSWAVDSATVLPVGLRGQVVQSRRRHQLLSFSTLRWPLCACCRHCGCVVSTCIVACIQGG